MEIKNKLRFSGTSGWVGGCEWRCSLSKDDKQQWKGKKNVFCGIDKVKEVNHGLGASMNGFTQLNKVSYSDRGESGSENVQIWMTSFFNSLLFKWCLFCSASGNFFGVQYEYIKNKKLSLGNKIESEPWIEKLGLKIH